MGLINRYIQEHEELFRFLPAKEVHHHDEFLHRWIIRFFPKSITPNKLTLLRVILTPIVFYLVESELFFWGVALFLFAAFTDALDGSMARVENKITQFGMLFDPLADKLLIGTMILSVVFTHFHPMLGIAVLGIEIIFIITALVAKIKFKTVRMANVWGKVKMVLQVIAVFLTLTAVLLDFPLLIWAAAWLFGIAIGFALLSLFKHGI